MTFILISIITFLGSTVSYYFLISDKWYFIPVWLILGLLTSLLVIILFLIILLPFMKYAKLNSKKKHWLMISLSRFTSFYTRVKVKSYGIEDIPKTGKLTVYGNHKSQLDPFLIAIHFPRLLAYTPKISIYKLPIINKMMHYFNFLPIDRDDNRRTAQTMIKAIKNVEKGLAMVIFPEAGIKTRETHQILDIKGGAFKIGMKAKSDFLPVSIVGAHKIADLKWYQKAKIEVYYHPVIKYEDVKDLNSLELAELIKDKINSKLD